MPAWSRRLVPLSGSLAGGCWGRWNRPCAGPPATANIFWPPFAASLARSKILQAKGTGVATGPGIRVRVSAPAAEARKLIARLVRGGVPAAPDDGSSSAELLVVSNAEPEALPKFRARASWLVVLGAPGAPYFAQGADEVVVPGEPEILFRRLRLLLERRDLVAKAERLTERVQALEAGLADAAHD